MKKSIILKVVCAGCFLALLSGCGRRAPEISPVVEQPASNVQADAGNEGQSYITVAEAKAAVLENAGISEENVKFVRVNLDSESGVAKYEIEFVSEETEYDYTVNALTGEIISMICENGSYDIESIPQEVVQAAQEQAGSGNDSPGSQQGTEGQAGSGNDSPGSQQGTEGQAGSGNDSPGSQQGTEGQAGSGNDSPGSQQGTEGQAGSGSVPSGNTQAAQGQPKAGSTGQAAGTKQQYIGVEAAKNAALNHAGLSADAVRFVHAHLEFDDGYWQYDVEFHKDSTEYDYNIDALSGEVISFDYDAEYYQHGADSSSGSGQITKDKAKQIALEYAGIAEKDAQYLKIEFDYDDGRAEYQVEWYVGRMEYSCDVDANTGAILSFEKEYD